MDDANPMGPLDPRRDLIERLDFLAGMYGMGEKIAFGTDQQTALDAITRIEALEAEIKRLKARVRELEAALSEVVEHAEDMNSYDAGRVARYALAALEGS